VITENMEAIFAQIRKNGYKVDSDIIMELITEHDTKTMLEGVRYYRSKSDITEREMYYYNSQGQKVVDSTKENHKLVNNWHKLLVDQKVSYLVGRPMVFTVEDSQEGQPNAEFAEKIELLLGDEWDDIVADVATNTSNKGTEWLHLYIDKKGYFKYIIAPAEEIIPVYDSAAKNNLEALLRYYSVKINGKERYRAEWWTRDDLTIYIENDVGDFALDLSETPNPAMHFNLDGKGQGWGKVPFIEFPNNSFKTSDLEVTKSLVDEYDMSFSDFANNNAEIQEIITILKGYEGTDLAEFKQNLRFYKVIKLRADSSAGVDTLEFNIPTEAKKELLDRLEENIFMFGQGVNVKTDRFGNSPSGASLQFLYTLLDLKVSMMERKFKSSVKRMLWFTTTYINMEWHKEFNPEEVKATFRKNRIKNTKEEVETLRASRDMISDETIVSLHPLIEDGTKEYQLLLEQRKAQTASMVNLSKNADDVDLKEVDINEQ